MVYPCVAECFYPWLSLTRGVGESGPQRGAVGTALFICRVGYRAVASGILPWLSTSIWPTLLQPVLEGPLVPEGNPSAAGSVPLVEDSGAVQKVNRQLSVF
jgi:hypothetical protein